MSHANHDNHEAACDDRISCVAALARGFIHETNNATGAILNNCHCLASAVDAPQRTRSITNIRRSAQRLAALSQMLQYYTRDMTVPVEAVNLPPLLVKACRRFLAGPEMETVHLDVQVPAGNLYAITNSALLEDALLALLHNAQESYDAPPYPVRISLQASPELLDASQDLSLGHISNTLAYLCIQVSDQGCGVPHPDHCRIFEPFYSTKMRARGLGLAYVAGLVMHTNAQVSFHRGPQAGTTVQLLLPQTT